MAAPRKREEATTPLEILLAVEQKDPIAFEKVSKSPRCAQRALLRPGELKKPSDSPLPIKTQEECTQRMDLVSADPRPSSTALY